MTTTLFGAASVRSTRRSAPPGRGVGPSSTPSHYSIVLAFLIWICSPMLLWSGLVFLVWRLI